VQVTDTTINYEAKNLIDKDFLYPKYMVEGANLAYIADLAGVSKTTVKDRVKSFGLKRQDEGPRLRGQVPYPWRLVKGKLVEHLAEQKIIGQMVVKRDDGASYGDLVDWLNDNGVRTKNGAGRWDRPTVYKILKRRLAAR
jgi:Recombinase